MSTLPAMNIANLTGKSLMLATPVYNLTASTTYQNSILELASLCRAYGVMFSYASLHDSLVTRARNRLVDIFLSQPQYDYHMWVDSDIQFSPPDVLQLMMRMDADHEFICGAYPKKQINWHRVRDAVRKNPDIEPSQLELCSSDFVMNLVSKPDGQKMSFINIGELAEITDAGTGFMLLHRNVYNKLIASGTIADYTPMADEPSFGGPTIYNFFHVDVDQDTNNYLSEDYWFSRQWKKIGGKVWLAPWVNLVHYGQYAYKGTLTALAGMGLNT